eukprot:PhM_4_TR1927/c0_g1_i1/m.3625/K08343/ATG3; ubiquitin-like-conjugating enzyme ATG3
MASKVKNATWEWYKGVVNQLTGPQTHSSFQKTGRLTPQEFEQAGDALVQRYPVWAWQSGPAAVDPHLKPDKKYLLLRGAPCLTRATNMMGEEGGDKDGEDGWAITHVDHVVHSVDDGFVDDDAVAKPAPATTAVAAAANDDDEWGDDITVQPATTGEEDPGMASGAGRGANAPGIVQCRRYDITVTYDTYHACPRAWLIGYNEHNQPLSKEEVCQDIYSDYADKTATVETHPFLNTPTVSIHPCKHTETMVALMQRMEDKVRDAAAASGELSEAEAAATTIVFPPFLAMFLFLKFISSVVPTVQYDITAGIEM